MSGYSSEGNRNEPLKSDVTIKGGVVMRSISKNVRRATQDMDIDFIRYSLNEDAIQNFIDELNSLPGLQITMIGKTEELKQQDYHGKRVYIKITDDEGIEVNSKIDLGVHKNLQIEQDEYCFDVCISDEGASLLINSKEQMLTEKLRSLLKFGPFSTRFKDIFDIYYLSRKVHIEKLMNCFDIYIFSDPGMREKNLHDIIKRVQKTFADKAYQSKLASSKKNWLDTDTKEVLEEIILFLSNIQ